LSKENILRDFIEEIWNNQRKDLINNYITPKYHIYIDAGDPWEGKDLDHDSFKERLDYSFNSFPDIKFEITSAIEEENHVAISWILTGTNLGSINGTPATQKRIETTGMTFYHFKDNLISGHTQVFDRQTVARQLGF